MSDAVTRYQEMILALYSQVRGDKASAATNHVCPSCYHSIIKTSHLISASSILSNYKVACNLQYINNITIVGVRRPVRHTLCANASYGMLFWNSSAGKTPGFR